LHGAALCPKIVMAMEDSARKRWSEEETVLALYLYFRHSLGGQIFAQRK
jgi:hypothetical protein